MQGGGNTGGMEGIRAEEEAGQAETGGHYTAGSLERED